MKIELIFKQFSPMIRDFLIPVFIYLNPIAAWVIFHRMKANHENITCHFSLHQHTDIDIGIHKHRFGPAVGDGVRRGYER